MKDMADLLRKKEEAMEVRLYLFTDIFLHTYDRIYSACARITRKRSQSVTIHREGGSEKRVLTCADDTESYILS